jgi:hypothetical protein
LAFADQVALTKDSAFRDRVRMAAVTAAVLVAGEAQSALSTTAYLKRQGLATRVLAAAGHGEHSEILDMFVWAVSQNGAVSAASLDSDIQFTVNSIWSDCAGVTVLD